MSPQRRDCELHPGHHHGGLREHGAEWSDPREWAPVSSAWGLGAGCFFKSLGWPRSPSALLPFFGGGFPYENRLQKKGTLILTSLLEDLVALPLKVGQKERCLQRRSLSAFRQHGKLLPHSLWAGEEMAKGWGTIHRMCLTGPEVKVSSISMGLAHPLVV